MQNVLCLQQLFAVKCMWAAPDWDAGVMSHTASHGGFCSFDDALILRRVSDACTCCSIKQRKCTSVYAQKYAHKHTNTLKHGHHKVQRYYPVIYTLQNTHTHTHPRPRGRPRPRLCHGSCWPCRCRCRRLICGRGLWVNFLTPREWTAGAEPNRLPALVLLWRTHTQTYIHKCHFCYRLNVCHATWFI